MEPENATPKYRELEKRFEELVSQERQVLKKGEFERLYTREGGSGLNAFTNTDMTVYFVNVPKNKLELWFWLESDRLSQSLSGIAVAPALDHLFDLGFHVGRELHAHRFSSYRPA